MKKKNGKIDYQKKFGVFITDADGIVVRCFNAKKAAFGWLDKHCPELSREEKAKRVWTFSSYRKVSKFFEEQIRKGCTDSEVLALMTYYCGVSTKKGFDLKNGRTIAGEKPAARDV